MRSTHLSAVLAVGLCAALSCGGGVASAAARSGVTSATPSVLTCAGKAVHEPSSLVLYCADAGASLIKIKWTSWTSSRASAKATYRANNCKPNCAAGKFYDYSATFTLTKPKRVKKFGLVFTELTVVYIQNRRSHSFNYPLPTTAL